MCHRGWASVSFAAAFVFLVCASASASTVSFSQKSSAGLSLGVHADLNADGREDFAYPAENGAGFDVQLSTGDGTYAAAVAYTLPNNNSVADLTVADFNSDGKADLLIFGTSGGSQYTTYLYVNNGAGTYTLSKSYAIPNNGGGSEAGMVAADFNHDGHMDFAWEQYPYVDVWLGNGAGGFTPGPSTQVQLAGQLMVGDFDGDGHGDIAVGDFTNYQYVEVLYGDGTGAFPEFKIVDLPQGSHSLWNVGDVNSDGKSDLIASTFYPNNPNYVSVYYGLADRSWTANTTMPISHCAGRSAPIAADMNGDGINDLVVPESDCNDAALATHYVGVLLRNSDSSYNTDQIIYQSSAPDLVLSNVTVLRANADTKPDIALSQCSTAPCSSFSEYGLRVLLNTTSGTFHSCSAPDAFVGIDVCSPTATSSTTSVPFRIGAAGQTPMRKVEVWVDGQKLGEQLNGFSNYSFFDRTFTISPGSHQVDIYGAGWDNALVRKSFTLSVQ